MLQLAATRKVELTDEFLGARIVPRGIERFEIGQKILHCHPIRHLLVFRDVSNVLEFRWPELARVDPEHLSTAGGHFEDIHEYFDCGSFSGAVRSDETVDACVGNI